MHFKHGLRRCRVLAKYCICQNRLVNYSRDRSNIGTVEGKSMWTPLKQNNLFKIGPNDLSFT